DVESGNFARREGVAEDADDAGAHGIAELIETEMVVGAGDFLQKPRDVDDPKVVGPERAEADDAEVLVADHHWIGRAPLVAGEEPRGDEVDVGLERRFESVLQPLEPRKSRVFVGGQRVVPGAKEVAVLAEVYELDRLRLAHNELRAAFDFLVLVREAEREWIARVIAPLPDLHQLS